MKIKDLFKIRKGKKANQEVEYEEVEYQASSEIIEEIKALNSEIEAGIIEIENTI